MLMAVLFAESWQPNELVYKLQRFGNLFHTCTLKKEKRSSYNSIRHENFHQETFFGFVLIFREK